MSQVLATAYGEVVKSDGKVDEKALTDLLKKMPVQIGAGKQTVRNCRVPCASALFPAAYVPHLNCSHGACACLAAQVSLYDFLPAACLKDAVKIFEDFQRDL